MNIATLQLITQGCTLLNFHHCSWNLLHSIGNSNHRSFTLVVGHGLISFLGAETHEAKFQECRLNWYEYCHLLLNDSGLTLLNCFLWSWNFFHYNAKSYILDFQLKCQISQTGLIMPIWNLKFSLAIWIVVMSLRGITKPLWYIGSEPNFKQIMHCH